MDRGSPPSGLRPNPPRCWSSATFDDDDAVIDAVRAGARLSAQDVTLDQLVGAIRAVHEAGAPTSIPESPRLCCAGWPADRDL